MSNLFYHHDNRIMIRSPKSQHLSRKTRLRCQPQRWQAEYRRPIKCIVRVNLVSAVWGAVGEGRAWQAKAERLLGCIARDGIRIRTLRAINTGASRCHFRTMLYTCLRPK